MANTFDWIEIRTHDIQRAADFYESLFGWRISTKETADGSAMWIFDTGDEPRVQNLRRGGIWLRPEGESQGIVVYIVVEDIEATLEKVRDFGGSVVSGKAPLGRGYGAYFQDPSGNLFGLYEDKGAEQVFVAREIAGGVAVVLNGKDVGATGGTALEA